MARVDNLKTLILEHNRRLQKLKEQEARYGYSVDPHILLEIEDIEAKLQALQTELNQLRTSNELLAPATDSPMISSRPGADQYHSCFISYSHQDEAFVERLYDDLQQQGVRCWYTPHDMRIGDKIRPTIERSIQSHEKLLLVLSEHALESNWVEKEVEMAFEKEYQQKQVMLFPIRLDTAVMETNQAWAADIRRTRHIGDFSRWQDELVYQKALKRLLRDLQAVSPPKSPPHRPKITRWLRLRRFQRRLLSFRRRWNHMYHRSYNQASRQDNATTLHMFGCSNHNILSPGRPRFDKTWNSRRPASL